MDTSRSISKLGLAKDIYSVIFPYLHIPITVLASNFYGPKMETRSQLGLAKYTIFPYLHIPNITVLASKLYGVGKLLTTPLRFGRLDRGQNCPPPLPPRRHEHLDLGSNLKNHVALSTKMYTLLRTDGFLHQCDVMTMLGLSTYTPPLLGQDTEQYKKCRHQEENVLRLWELVFPDNPRCLTISEISQNSVIAFAVYAFHVLRLGQIPRHFPFGMLVHTEDDLYYQESFSEMWKLKLDTDEFKHRLLAWYPRNAYGIGTFLGTWIDEARNEDIPAVAEALSSLMNRYGLIKSLESMDNIRHGNLIASLIRICGYSQRSMGSTLAFLNSMLSIVGHHRMILIFNAVVRRLDTHDDLVLSFYLFYRNIPESSSEKESQDLVLDLLTAVDRELREIDGANLAYWDSLGIPFLRSYFHIAECLSLHADYWEHDIYFFYHLTRIPEQAIGSMNREIWCYIGKEELYKRATRKIEAEFDPRECSGLTTPPLDIVGIADT